MVLLSGLVDCANEINPAVKFATPSGDPLLAVHKLLPQVAPPSVDSKMPAPLTAANTLEGLAVSRWRSVIVLVLEPLTSGRVTVVMPLVERITPRLVASSS